MPITPEMIFAENTPDTTEREAMIKAFFSEHGKWITVKYKKFVEENYLTCNSVNEFAENFFIHFLLGKNNNGKPVEILTPPREYSKKFKQWLEDEDNQKELANAIAEVRKVKFGIEEIKPDQLDQEQKNILGFIFAYENMTPETLARYSLEYEENLSLETVLLISLFKERGERLVKQPFIKEYFRNFVSMSDFSMKFFQRNEKSQMKWKDESHATYKMPSNKKK